MRCGGRLFYRRRRIFLGSLVIVGQIYADWNWQMMTPLKIVSVQEIQTVSDELVADPSPELAMASAVEPEAGENKD